MSQLNPENIGPQSGLPDYIDRPASWGETLLALVPFLILPAFFLLFRILSPLPGFENVSQIVNIFSAVLFIASLAFMWGSLVIAWVTGFPRWTFAYVGFILLVVLYLSNFRGTLFGYDFTGSWWLWIPVLAIPVIGLLLSRSLHPIYQLISSVWQDWTLVSFAFYSILPLIIFAAYDEVHDSGLMQIVGMLILAGGVLFYIRSGWIWQRFAGLLGGFLLAWGVTVVYLASYWANTPSPGWDAPVPWRETISWTSRLGLIPVLLLLAPILLAALRWMVGAGRTPKAA